MMCLLTCAWFHHCFPAQDESAGKLSRFLFLPRQSPLEGKGRVESVFQYEAVRARNEENMNDKVPSGGSLGRNNGVPEHSPHVEWQPIGLVLDRWSVDQSPARHTGNYISLYH